MGPVSVEAPVVRKVEDSRYDPWRPSRGFQKRAHWEVAGYGRKFRTRRAALEFSAACGEMIETFGPSFDWVEETIGGLVEVRVVKDGDLLGRGRTLAAAFQNAVAGKKYEQPCMEAALYWREVVSARDGSAQGECRDWAVFTKVELKRRGIEARVVHATFRTDEGPQCHVWLEVAGRVLDGTADQFQSTVRERIPPVVWALFGHAPRWEGHTPCPAANDGHEDEAMNMLREDT